jgi:TatD DNase family protein
LDSPAPAPAAPLARSLAPLIDIGINLTHDSYDADREEVISRAARAGVAQLIVTGASLESTRKAIELSRSHPAKLFATAGLHPHHASELTAELFGELGELALAPPVVAIGECGLDYFRNYSPRHAQQQAFHRQLELAARTRKPVFLHQRDAHADFVAILREHLPDLIGAVAHCFTGGATELESYLSMGLAIGITGWICDERRGRHLLELVRDIPAERLLLETDGPYLLPRDLEVKPARRRNEPAFLPHIAAVVARARGESPEALAMSSTQAAQRLFHIPDVGNE